MHRTRRFHTIEALLAFVQTNAQLEVPRLTAGRRKFFRQINRWWFESSHEASEIPALVLLPDPTLNLTLPYARDEISLALTIAHRRYYGRQQVDQLANTFGVSPILLDRPVTALSGGERLLIALCKTALLSEVAKRAYLCNPTFWLDSRNRESAGRLFERLAARSIDLDTLLLDGEAVIPPDTIDYPGNRSLAMPWTLSTDQLVIRFPEVHFPQYTPETRIKFFTETPRLELTSPTLLEGPNGVGKTSLSKILSGVIQPDKGTFLIQSAGYTGNARLFMQDSLDHIFGESILAHFERVFRYDADRRKAALGLFNKFSDKFAQFFLDDPERGALGPREAPETLLQCKLALLAERIASEPPLLVLDEPGWGLSRPVTGLFVELACSCARERKIPVIIISHHVAWVSDKINSILTLKNGSDSSGEVVEIRSRRLEFGD